MLEQPFAVILMDVQMPVMDGYETARLIRMRKDSEHTPIIFVTAHTRDEAQLAVAYASGAVDFMFAPILPDILRAKVSIFADLFIGSRALARSVGNITELSEQFRDSEARTRSVLENVADGIITVSDEGAIESLNAAAAALFGYVEHEAVGQPFSSLVTPQNPADFAGRDAAGQPLLTLPTSTARPAIAVGLHKDGSTFPMELDVRHVELGARRVHIACMRDVSERQSYVQALKYQALHDGLTELPNRALFEDRVNHAISAASRENRGLALLLLDLDGFKAVNDTLGHQHGDMLLKLVGERLAGCLREGDTVARLGGDEFGVLPAVEQRPVQRRGRGPDHRARARGALRGGRPRARGQRQRRHDLLPPARRQHRRPAPAGGPCDVRRQARRATATRCSRPSRRRPPRAGWPCSRTSSTVSERDELVLHYQPKIDLATGRADGVEALIRWQHPTRGLLMPGEFMTEVEGNELLVPITDWVMRESLAQLQVWREDGYDLTMAVNIGARCLAEGTALFETADALTTQVRDPRRPADLRAHREGADRHQPSRAGRAPAGHGRAAVDRRLRHRLLVAGVPAADAGGGDQGRQDVREHAVPGER